MTDFMPALDVSALQAAVAAAAEIARVGLSDSLVVLQPNNEGSPPAAGKKEQEFSNPPPAASGGVVNAAATATAPSSQQQYHPIVEAPSTEDTATHCSEDIDQCTEHDAAGDHNSTTSTSHDHHEHHIDNDNNNNHDTFSVASSNPDAAGEKSLEETEEDAAKRLARSRERNREHARRTRLRKKAQLEHLQQKVRGLEADKKGLKQKIEECSIASILINLAEPSQEEQEQQQQTVSLLDDTMKKQENNDSDAKISLLTAGKRKRFASIDNASEESRPTQALKLKIDGQTKILGPKSHVNWKSGVYSDEHGVQRQLTSEQLEGLRYVPPFFIILLFVDCRRVFYQVWWIVIILFLDVVQ